MERAEGPSKPLPSPPPLNLPAPQGADPYDFATPKEILASLAAVKVTIGDDPPVPFWECFESKKWNLRKGALDRLRDAARAPRLAPGDYGDVARELKKVLAKDANITCATAAAEAVGALAAGLRREFSGPARMLCPAVLERFKDKNIMMSKAGEEALRAMATHCYSLADVADDLAAAMEHKNPKSEGVWEGGAGFRVAAMGLCSV